MLKGRLEAADMIASLVRTMAGRDICPVTLEYLRHAWRWQRAHARGRCACCSTGDGRCERAADDRLADMDTEPAAGSAGQKEG